MMITKYYYIGTEILKMTKKEGDRYTMFYLGDREILSTCPEKLLLHLQKNLGGLR